MTNQPVLFWLCLFSPLITCPEAASAQSAHKARTQRAAATPVVIAYDTTSKPVGFGVGQLEKALQKSGQSVRQEPLSPAGTAAAVTIRVASDQTKSGIGEEIRTSTIKARNEYHMRYLAARKVLVDMLTAQLKADPDKDKYKAAFSAGNKTLQDRIDTIVKDAQRRAATGQTIWSLAKLIPVIGQVVTLAQQFLTKDGVAIDPNRTDFHRFSEVAPEIVTDNPIEYLPQWIDIIQTVTTLEIAKEYQTVYDAVYPLPIAQNLVQTISKNGKTIALAAVGFAIFKKLNR